MATIIAVSCAASLTAGTTESTISAYADTERTHDNKLSAYFSFDLLATEIADASLNGQPVGRELASWVRLSASDVGTDFIGSVVLNFPSIQAGDTVRVPINVRNIRKYQANYGVTACDASGLVGATSATVAIVDSTGNVLSNNISGDCGFPVSRLLDVGASDSVEFKIDFPNDVDTATIAQYGNINATFHSEEYIPPPPPPEAPAMPPPPGDPAALSMPAPELGEAPLIAQSENTGEGQEAPAGVEIPAP